jgi:hypothetical protein
MPNPFGVNGLLDFVQVDGDINAVFHGFSVLSGWVVV